MIGEKFSNQLEFIRQIVRTTPIDYKIYVKEHPHDFGRRKLIFYKNINLMPSVKLIDPYFSNEDKLKILN